jgi:SAM-dependent methyltransferase
LNADLGDEQYDFVFIGNLLHHFDAEANRTLVARIARALRPGGVFAAFEVLRPPRPQAAGQMEVLADLYFAVTSKSGTWSAPEIADWQSAAGLEPRRAARMLTAPGFGLQAARKPRS